MTSQRISSIVLMTIAITTSTNALAANDACPSIDDTEYAIHVGDTWDSLGARAYCRNGPHDRTQAALALYEYNRGRVGPTITELPDGTKVCLPKHLHGRYFDAELCEAAPKTVVTAPIATNVSSVAVCGNGIRDGDETCDGADLAGTACGTFGLPSGRVVCRGNCRGFDASACFVPPPPPPPPPPPASTAPSAHAMSIALGADASAGVMFALSNPGAPTAYGTIGLARVGARLDVGPIQLIGHAIAGSGGGTTLLDGHDADLGVQVAGGSMQLGIPLPVRFVSIIPGVEAQRLYMNHRIDARPPYGPDHRETSGAITILGAFMRSEYRFRRVPRLAASFELAFGYVPGEVAGLPSSTRIQMKTLAGVTYHAF